MRAGLRRFALAALAAAALAGCRTPARPPDVLLIVVDTLRADRLGCYGNPDGLTPFIDSLAARGRVFRRAYAQSSWTNPSVASLFTSRYQSQHNVVDYGSVLNDAEVTLAETLRRAGYATGGFSANTLIAPKFGFGQGFDVYRAHWVRKTDDVKFLWLPERAPTINADALGWLDELPAPAGRRPPTFLYVHYMEPHSPYAPDEAMLARVFRDRPPPDVRQVNLDAYLGNLGGASEDLVRDVAGLYDASVASLDAGLRALFAELERRGFLAHALVVFTADHGEELGEHGRLGHEKTLFEEVVRVPLVVVGPGVGRGDVDRVVSLVDVAPTVLAAAGVSRPAPFEGASLADLLPATGLRSRLRRTFGAARDEGPEPVAYTELLKTAARDERRVSPHERALVTRARKLIVGVNGEREFYRLDRDPGEKDPAGLDAPERRRLEARLEAVRLAAERDRAPAEAQPLDAATRERLRALGYAGN